MAHPRRIVPGETYLITRRCYQRTFRLCPGPETNRIFMYCLAFATRKTGVVLHAACVMSNHHHLVVTDTRGALPDFLRELHRLTAKAMNALQGEWENLWAAEPASVVRLVTDGDVEEKIAYVAANPVAAGLVNHPDAWPGVLVWGQRTLQVRRPSAYFSSEGICPETLTLAVEPPARRNDDGLSLVEWFGRVGRIVSGKVAAAHRAVQNEGREFLGAAAVMSASFMGRASSYEDKRGRIPTFAARVRYIWDRLRRVEQDFRRRYQAARKAWRGGDRDVSFPLGTWAMRVFHGARVDAVTRTAT